MNYNEAVNYLFEKLAPSKIMALASSVNNHVMVRNVSCLIYDNAIYFKTDKNFRKTKQLYENPCVALCVGGIQVEGIANIKGLVVDEPGRQFEKLYQKYLWGSYNAYSHEESEILVEVKPTFVEIWDTDSKNKAFQIFIDFDNQQVEYKQYDD
ncbi:pyridoxamine 5'-phosphate oxidase family protein [Candidatus Stoquefichus massiliensis]|uniref:pyridoxamine 5'-phosphate oxidase family protein n=1 Tax=Candidatus Stoquefichus massiliensis TaxID=1470350 RepID=UPI000480620F|nr:pyridoxamine 5'-phosphate oxidase family protein [Candidatus Stoquefichus massiliensis]